MASPSYRDGVRVAVAAAAARGVANEISKFNTNSWSVQDSELALSSHYSPE